MEINKYINNNKPLSDGDGIFWTINQNNNKPFSNGDGIFWAINQNNNKFNLFPN